MISLNKFFGDSFYRQTMYVFFTKVLSSIIGFGTTVILVKSLGGQSSSEYFFLISLISVLTAVSTFGSPDAILKFVAINKKHGNLVKLLVTNACLVAFGISLAIVLLTYIVGFFFKDLLSDLLVLSMLILLPLSSLSLILSSALQGRGKVALAMITSGMLQNITVLVSLFFFADTYFETVFSFALGNLAASFVAIYFFRKDLNNDLSSYNKNAYKSTCAAMFISQCVVQYNNNSAILLLGILWCGTDLSIMAVSLKLTTLLSFIIISVNKVMAPKIASTYGDVGELQKLITKSSRLMWLLCFPAVIALMLFSREILGMVDESYRTQNMVLIILVFGQLINVITGNIGLLLSMTGHEKIQRNILLASLLVSLLLGGVLIPTYGPLGAAIMASTTIVLVNLSSYFYVLCKLKVNTLKLI